MKTECLAVQGAASAVIGWLAARLGLMFGPLVILTALMVLDYITGMLASKAEAIRHPENPAFGWSSRKGILGIIKKVGYWGIIAVAVCLDQIILTGLAQISMEPPVRGLFGLIVTVWFALNEMLSIIENAGRMGADIPPWLARYIAVLKGKIDEEYTPESDNTPQSPAATNESWRLRQNLTEQSPGLFDPLGKGGHKEEADQDE